MTPLEDGSTHEHEPPSAPADPAGASAPAPLTLVEEPRRYPSTIGGALYLTILGVMILALVVVGLGHWRGGVHILAGAMVGAALARAVLSKRDAGMLEVRSRWFDVTLLATVGVVMWVLASTIPAQG